MINLNPYQILSITKVDSNNTIAFTEKSNRCLRSSDNGVTWKMQTCFDTICTIYDSKFIDSKIGWCVGGKENFQNIIYKTTDGGLNWTRIHLGFPFSTLLCVDFINSNTGWAGGWSEYQAIKTTDGGLTWVQKPNPTLRELRSISFIDENTGWMCGRNKWILKTTNGGDNWIAQSPDIRDYWAYLESIYVSDDQNSWVTGSYVDSTSTLKSFTAKTTNGGDNWVTVFEEANVSSFKKICFLNPSIGYLYGYRNYILKTTTAGQNWFVINTGNNGTIQSMEITNENEMIAGGGSYDPPANMIIKTTDSGVNWSLLSSNKYYDFNSVTCINKDTVIVVGSGGIIYRSTDQGGNWEKIASGVTKNLNAVSFFDERNGCIFADEGRILHTSTSGREWSVNDLQFFPGFKSSSIVNPTTGFAFGDYGKIFKTTNSGLNWIDVSAFNYSYFSSSFSDSLHGWAIGYYYDGFFTTRYRIFKTTNSGITWGGYYNSTTESFYKIQFTDSLTGFLSGSFGTRKTTDGGLTWQTLFTTRFNPIVFLNDSIAYGHQYNSNHGLIYKSTNTGQNWTLQFDSLNAGAYSILVVDSLNSWFVGPYNSIYKTTNGGGSLVSVYEPENVLPTNFIFYQNYPNPFNPITKITFYLPRNANVKLIVYDMLGKEVKSIVNSKLSMGRHEYDFDGSNFASGVYYYKLISDEFVETKKMILLK